MKFRRFLALFLLLALLASQCLCLAYAEGEEDFEQIHIDAGEALLMDADSGAILYQQNAHEQVSIASVTKVMTCLVVLEAIERQIQEGLVLHGLPGDEIHIPGAGVVPGVVLGAGIAPDGKGGTNIMSFTETVRLFKWGFENFSTKTILEEEELIAEVPVALSKETNYVTVHPAYSVQSMLPNYLAPEELQRDVALDAETADAPIAAGQELGTITLSHGDIVYATVPLLALNDVSVSKFLVAKRAVEEFFAPAIVKILTVLAIVFIVAAVQLVRSYLRRRRYGRNDRRGGRKAYRGRRF